MHQDHWRSQKAIPMTKPRLSQNLKPRILDLKSPDIGLLRELKRSFRGGRRIVIVAGAGISKSAGSTYPCKVTATKLTTKTKSPTSDPCKTFFSRSRRSIRSKSHHEI